MAYEKVEGGRVRAHVDVVDPVDAVVVPRDHGLANQRALQLRHKVAGPVADGPSLKRGKPRVATKLKGSQVANNNKKG